jgi:hypothetical protein
MPMLASNESYQTFVDSELVEAPVNGEASGFVIDDASKADWGLTKLSQVEAARMRDQAFIEAERDRLARWLETREAQRQRFQDYLTSLLARYFDDCRARGEVRGKSLVLPHGRLQVRTQEAKYTRDDDALLAALEGRYTRIKAEVDWQALKPCIAPVSDQPFAEVALETGEVLPGLRLQSPATDVFKASPTLD